MSLMQYDHEEPNSSFVGVSIFVTSVLIVVIMIVAYFIYISFLSFDQNQKYGFSKTDRLDELNAEYESNLNDLQWVNKSKGIVKVPIDQAMQNVVNSYNQ